MTFSDWLKTQESRTDIVGEVANKLGGYITDASVLGDINAILNALRTQSGISLGFMAGVIKAYNEFKDTEEAVPS